MRSAHGLRDLLRRVRQAMVGVAVRREGGRVGWRGKLVRRVDARLLGDGGRSRRRALLVRAVTRRRAVRDCAGTFTTRSHRRQASHSRQAERASHNTTFSRILARLRTPQRANRGVDDRSVCRKKRQCRAVRAATTSEERGEAQQPRPPLVLRETGRPGVDAPMQFARR